MSIPAGIYQHYKGSLYKVLEVARHSETEEELVIYQALYGEKGIWARPLSMFTENIERDGIVQARFAYCSSQTEVLELAILNIKDGRADDFEQAFAKAQNIISAMPGYIRHQLRRCVENPQQYLLLVSWETIEDHNVGFRNSAEYQQWRTLLHDFYQPFPSVEHYSLPLNSVAFI